MVVKNDGKVRGNISFGDKFFFINGVFVIVKVVVFFYIYILMIEIKGKKRKVGLFKEDKENVDKNKIFIDILVFCCILEIVIY